MKPDFEDAYNVVSAAQIIEVHTELEQSESGLPGIADPSRAEAVYGRIKTLYCYGELADVYHVAAAYLLAIARGHIFADYNKRTAITCTTALLYLNGIILDNAGDQLEELTVEAARGDLSGDEVAAKLKALAV